MAYPKLKELIKFVRKQTPDPTGPNDMEEFVEWVSNNVKVSSSPAYEYHNVYHNHAYISGQEYHIPLMEGKHQSFFLQRTDGFFGENSGLRMDWGMTVEKFASITFSVHESSNHDWFIWFSSHTHNFPSWMVYRRDLIGTRFSQGVYMHRARITPEISSLTIEFTVSQEEHPNSGGLHVVSANLTSLVYFTDLRNPGGSGGGGV